MRRALPPPSTVRGQRLPFPDVTDIAPPTTSFATLFDSVVANITTVLHGKRDAIEFAVMALLAEGHLLIEDVPGVGKTSLAKALAGSIDCSWKRVQFTPDLLPTDLVGVSIYERSTEQFRFQPGPLFANIVLADEINRASPKTQSALLEAMEERQVSADGTTHKLPPPFMVIATQNPVEQEGTYRLPGEPARPLPAADLARLPGPHRRDGDPRRAGLVRGAPRACSRWCRPTEVLPDGGAACAPSTWPSALEVVHGRHRRGEPPPLGDRARPVAPRHAAARRRRPGPRRRAWPRLRHARRRQGGRRRRCSSHRLMLRAGSNARTSAEDAIRELLADVPVPVAR